MTSRDFVYWLQGFFEISDAETITKEQITIIKNHLNLVFYHEIDPDLTNNDAKKKAEMDAIHNGHPSGGKQPTYRSEYPVLLC